MFPVVDSLATHHFSPGVICDLLRWKKSCSALWRVGSQVCALKMSTCASDSVPLEDLLSPRSDAMAECGPEGMTLNPCIRVDSLR